MARRKHPDFRELDGILLLDKPAGASSNQALQLVRRLYGAEKGGHTGSLDPLATGLLPLCFGESTKIAGLLLAERKAYETVARFGVATDTADADGTVVSRRDVPVLEPATLSAALLPFVGRIRQVPPIYSALKQDGEPLYAKARRGETVEVAAREVDVFVIDLLESGADWARLRIECGSGTYIRSLVRDLGEALGCGAHVERLRRLWVEPFREPRMHTVEALEAVAAGGGHAALDALLLPIEAGLAHLPRIEVDAAQTLRLGQGQSIEAASTAPGDCVAMTRDGRALGLVRVDADGRAMPRRLLRWVALDAVAHALAAAD